MATKPILLRPSSIAEPNRIDDIVWILLLRFCHAGLIATFAPIRLATLLLAKLANTLERFTKTCWQGLERYTPVGAPGPFRRGGN